MFTQYGFNWEVRNAYFNLPWIVHHKETGYIIASAKTREQALNRGKIRLNKLGKKYIEKEIKGIYVSRVLYKLKGR